MNEPIRDTDEAIETMLAWRAGRAEPAGLLDEIHEGLAMQPQRRTYRALGVPLRLGRLAWLIPLIALVAIGAAGVAVVGGKPDIGPAVAAVPTATPSAPAKASLQLADCTAARAVPAGPAGIDLTGTWHDRADIYYLRQIGNVVWGAQRFLMGVDITDNAALTGQEWIALHGTVGPGPVVRLDWASAGAVSPSDPTPTPMSGAVVFNVVSTNGQVRLVATSQTGPDRLSGPSYADLTLEPCTPSVTLAP